MQNSHRAPLSKLLALALVAASSAALAESEGAPPAPTAAATAAATAKAAASGDAAKGDAAQPDAKKPAPKRDPAGALVTDDEDVPPPESAPPPPPPPRTRVRRRVAAPPPPPAPLQPGQARKGLLLSIGLGGASQYASAPGLGTAGAADFDMRFGYGFSDRFQLFADLDLQRANYGWDQATDNWMLTLRGQTVLIGDRKGNGLSLNGGVGFGGFSPDGTALDGSYCRGFGGCYGGRGEQLGFAAGGGLSFDARIGRYLAFSPELFASWHVVPNPDRRNDIVTEMGLRLNLLWYLP